MSEPYNRQPVRLVLDTTGRALARAASVIHQDFRNGHTTLATITCLAPFVGMLGTLWALGFDTFRGIGTDRATAMGAVADGLARACAPMALGLLVGLQSLWCYRYLQSRLAGFDREIHCASLDLLNQLSQHAGPIRWASPGVPYLEAYAPEAAAETRIQRRYTIAAVALVLTSWCVEASSYFELDSLPARAALSSGLCSVVYTLCGAALPAYAVWVDLLHRKPAAVVLIAAALCLCWCVTGLFVPSIRFNG